MFIVFAWSRHQHVWFLRSADGESIYRTTSSSSTTPPTQNWEVCKGKENEELELLLAEPAPRVLLGGDTATPEHTGCSTGDGGAKSKDSAKDNFVTVEGAGDLRFNGTYERTEKLAEAEDDDREGRVTWVKQGGDGEYMVMGGNRENQNQNQMDAAVWNMENPIYDGEDEGPEGGGDGYLDVESEK